ncbi:uncharacterized protein G2W53_033910 [Senna tora]|uniref:Uncharacterized protein n=1 Tax=Senna tora TaxID=362788 RepID=A0A834SZH0_9FABA|nr:uncharacterized protein G2W53_033910 [Senna tora]
MRHEEAAIAAHPTKLVSRNRVNGVIDPIFDNT